MRSYKIALMPGDGIGPEITAATRKVLSAVREKYGVTLQLREVEAGDECLKRRGDALPADSIQIIKDSDACLKAPVGESGKDVIVKLRIMFDLYANIRPVKSYPGVECLKPNIDFVIVRENTEDVYRGIEFEVDDATFAVRVITKKGCQRIAEHAFNLAEKRSAKKVTAVHKSNVLTITDGLFSRVCRDVASRHPNVKFNELYVDAAAMNLIRNPQDFDVIVTTNMFGDILSDEAAQLVGGLGMAPSANLGTSFALFEPAHGSAPDIAGKGIANPSSLILSSGLMLQWLGERFADEACLQASKKVEEAVVHTLGRGIRTPDLGGKAGTLDVAKTIADHVIGE